MPHKTEDHEAQANNFGDDTHNARIPGVRDEPRQGPSQSLVDDPVVAARELRLQIAGGSGGSGGRGILGIGGHGGPGEGPKFQAHKIVVETLIQNLVERPRSVLRASLRVVPQVVMLVDLVSKHVGRISSSDSMTSSNEFLLEALRVVSWVSSFRIAEYAYTRLILPRLATLSGGEPGRAGLS
ncbi:hypothetical protein C8R45DRAFT_1011386 [Mycena sanguinolenta]|nr:hypothetical protein C8R45DRAFT_1011386 [Mycena sanguinolenta]